MIKRKVEEPQDNQSSKQNYRKFWQFPWAYKESFVFALGVLVTGYILQFLLGSVRPLIFPNSLIIWIIYTLFLCLLFFQAKKSGIVRWLRSVSFAIAGLSALLIQAMVMGVVPQQNTSFRNPHDVFGLTDVMSSWPFILTMLLLSTGLGLVILNRLIPFRKKNIGFLFNHLGLWITLTAGFLGAGDLRRYTMDLKEGETEWMAMDGTREVEMPFAVQLNDFEMEEYDPKVTIVNTHTNEVLIEGKNAMRQLAKGDHFVLSDYRITVLEYWTESRSIMDRYEPVSDYGSAPAALVHCASPAFDTTAWISCGSFASMPSLIRFNDSTALVMMKPEPKRFRSLVTIYAPDEDQREEIIEVNKPCGVKGWKIYQVSYNEEMGKYSPQSMVEVIKDPWLPVVYAGVLLMMAGAVCMIFTGYNSKKG